MIRRLLGRRKQALIAWEIRITCPDGTLVDVDTESLYFIWKFGHRSTDGYLDLLADWNGGRLHCWLKPRGWQEPESRLAAIDGTGLILPGSP